MPKDPREMPFAVQIRMPGDRWTLHSDRRFEEFAQAEAEYSDLRGKQERGEYNRGLQFRVASVWHMKRLLDGWYLCRGRKGLCQGLGPMSYFDNPLTREQACAVVFALNALGDEQ